MPRRRSALLMALAALLAWGTFATARRSTPSTDVPRPPMYVVVSLDGGRSQQMWRETIDWTRELRVRGINIELTYFVSGVYFIPTERAHLYRAPGRASGESDVGFGGSAGDVTARVALVRQAVADGHEIGSHANGHYSGRDWSLEEWRSELAQFEDMVFGPLHSRLSVSREHLIGFRAPHLTGNTAMLRALKQGGYLYDASRIGQPGRWPQRRMGLWEFGLSRAALGGGRPTLPAMDYSFYVYDSNADEDPASATKYENQMLEAYTGLFRESYYGHRVPIQLLQHFELFNGGAYWRALRRFVTATCGLPEVECVSYRTLAEKLSVLPPGELDALRMGRFTRLPSS